MYHIRSQAERNALIMSYRSSEHTSQNETPNIFFKIVKSKPFSVFILFFIIASSVILALENPLDDPKAKKAEVLFILDILTLSVFLIEFVLKILAFGLIQGKKSYFKQSENIFDFFLILTQAVGLFDVQSIKILKIFRLFRVIRPLRIINKNEGLKVAFHTLMHAIPQIINLGVVSIVFYFLFGIFSVTLLKGRLFFCNETNIWFETYAHTSENKFDCINRGGEWEKRWLNFDNTIQAMITLFVMGSVAWIKTMWAAVDSIGID